MSNSLEDRLSKLQQEIAGKLRQLPPIIGKEVVNFSLDNFKAQAWQNKEVEPWEKRKSPTKWEQKQDDDRALLVNSGQLRRSIRVGKTHDDKVQIIAGGADTPYARAHNEGFKGLVHQHVREHIRRTRNGGQYTVKAHDRSIEQNIPKRQFIGNSAQSAELRERINSLIRKVLKQ
ncbi:MAG TPA: phage virion morphogenesis protein [Flavobacteriaceae bacterium]|nr:phage virion morphogenesis protein [Flavobacteriaceae bacterium]